MEEIKVRALIQDEISGKMRKIASGTKQNFGTMQKAAGGVTAGMKELALAAGGLFVFAKVIGYAKESIKLYDIQAKAEAQLAVSLGYTSKALLEKASALQKVTLFGDEETIAAMAAIAVYDIEEEKIAAIIPLVQDLATAQGMDLVTAAQMVGKTLGTSTDALARYIGKTEGSAGSTEQFTNLLEKLKEMMGDSAKAAAEAGAGGLKQYEMAVGDISEEIGGKLVPALNDAGRAFADNKKIIVVLIDVVGNVLKTVFNATTLLVNSVALALSGVLGAIAASLEGTMRFMLK